MCAGREVGTASLRQHHHEMNGRLLKKAEEMEGKRTLDVVVVV